MSSLELPNDDFDYDQFVKNEFSSQLDLKPRGLHWFWWLVAVIVLTGILYWLFSKVFTPLR